MNKIIALMALAFAPLIAVAQDSEYFNNAWWSCDLTDNQTVWHIKNYRSGISFINPTERASGTITFSDDCIEFNYPEFQMHFPVLAYKRVSEDIFSVSRNGEDDYFDYIEVVRVGQKRGPGATYRLMIAKLDPDNTTQNTRIFTCVPQRLQQGRDIKEALDAKPKSDGIPPQVPKK